MNFLLAQQTVTGKVADVGSELTEKVATVGGDTWERVKTQVTELVGGYLPNIVAALAILIIGWIVALFIAAIVRGVIRKIGIHRKVGPWLAPEDGGEAPDVGRKVGKGVFYVIMLFVLVAFFQTLGLTIVTEPLTAFLNKVFEYAPRLIAAGVLLFVAWLVASVVRFVVKKGCTAAKLDRRLSRDAGLEGDEDLPLTRTLSEGSYWLVFLLFLPALLDALAIPGLLAPVQNMVTQLLGFLPNLFAAAVLLAIGWFVARVVQRIATNLLGAIGTDKLSERVGLDQVIGGQKLSGVIGLLVYVLILVPVIVGSLNALQLEAVTQPASEMLNRILGALPGIVAAVLVVGIAYVVARVVAGLATNVLASIGFDRLPARLGLARETTEGRRTPSEIAGTVIMVAVVLFATMQALPMLGFDLLADMMSQFLGFASHVLLGLVIFGFGLYFAKLVADLITDSGIANADMLAKIGRVAILVLAGAMGLQQMGLAQEIVNLTYGLTLGALAVAVAIAFGIGGRDAAKMLVDDWAKNRRSKKQGN